MLYVFITIVVVLFVYALVTYNSLIKLDNIVKEAFSTMDIYLKKRWDLIPNLVEVVKGYSTYEKDTLENITTLRTNTYENIPVNSKININEQLTQGLAKIMAVSENYPDLKANETFLNLSHELTQIEDEIANSRKYYNGSVRIFNTKIKTFPNNIISGIFNFKPASMFEADIEEKNNIKVDM